MQYLKVRWIHDQSSEPIWLLSELDAERNEVRKVELFVDGRMGYADANNSSGETVLGEMPVPAASEIAADPQFVVEELSADAFEEAWRLAIAKRSRLG